MSHNVALEILADDSNIIAYRPKLAVFLGSVTAAILLQQIFYRFSHNKNEAFYKFRSNCNHELYKDGDSWCEELGYSQKQFDTALDVIGIKIEKGVSKSDAMAHDIEGDEFPISSIKYLVVYWTDSSRVTWYWLNRDLLGKSLKCIYLDKSTNGIYLKNTETAFTSNSENTTKKNPKNSRPSKPVASIERDALYWAIWNNWATGDKTVANIRQCIGNATPDDIGAFVAWYKKENPTLDLPLKDETVSRYWTKWQAKPVVKKSYNIFEDEEAIKLAIEMRTGKPS